MMKTPEQRHLSNKAIETDLKKYNVLIGLLKGSYLGNVALYLFTVNSLFNLLRPEIPASRYN